jgi:hypothetical protein
MDQKPDMNDTAGSDDVRSTWNPGDVVEQVLSVTAGDLDAILSIVADFPSND